MPAIEIELPPESAAPRRARDAVQALAGEVSGLQMMGLLTVVSELVTNSVVHGPTQPIQLRVEVRDDLIEGEVEDQGNGAAEIEKAANDEARRGLGLAIVDALVDEWGAFAKTTHVWFRMATEDLGSSSAVA